MKKDKHMKKIFSLFATMICFCLAFTGCYDDNSINVYVPDGAPALSVSEMLYTNEQFNENVTYNVVSANEIANTILQHTADIAIIPTNISNAESDVGGVLLKPITDLMLALGDFIMDIVHPSMDQLLPKVDSKYTLVVLAAKRARQILAGSPVKSVLQSHKDVTNALEEVAEDKITFARVKKSI